ncbi:DUF5995 family protein [Streptomyces sp. CBMA29]|uniref:DUF5995 family protein n=1 Tax=Streptomyces sp. CBMA29 TaxID=1896314 RepID=UPI0021D4482B|nr:DUF5995 family protein [Streptomyces sp. CBMA29]MBD0734532.1 hypothetical protein [Streptomyces sp. CBMA29]
MRTTEQDVASVVGRMRRAGDRRDGLGVFNAVYVEVTREVGRQLAANSFEDAETATRLAVRFANRYLTAVEDDARGRQAPASWRPLLRMRAHRDIRPLQFALAGINAHVGHDLPLAVVDTCRAVGREPPALAADFDRVGEILTGVEERVREELMPGPDLLELADPLTHVVGSWSLDRARDAAWAAARLLWALRDRPDAYEECVSRLDAGVGLVGRFLLTPVGRRT